MAATKQLFMWGIRAIATGTRFGVNAGRVRMGYHTPNKAPLTNSDTPFSFRLTGGSSGGTAQINWATGQVSVTAGNVTITDEGVDFEGRTLPTLQHINAIQMEATTVAGTVTITSSANGLPQHVIERVCKIGWLLNPADGTITGAAASGTSDFVFTNQSDVVDVFVLADVRTV
jgi:hypothetical protein